MKGWKRYEQNLTKFLNGMLGWQASRRSRAERGEEVMDIEWGNISVEAKCKSGRPRYLEDWLNQAKDNSEGLSPVVVWHQAYDDLGDDVVFLRLDELLMLLNSFKNTCDRESRKYSRIALAENLEELAKKIRQGG